ncbi:transposase [Nonomuraea polychroma]|uniref:transposase n=1 Tax=Nonomuraea polychroma TaxID=46176 RepID=UPI001F4DE28B|nr:transposase [Nonomuraea polychroma]
MRPPKARTWSRRGCTPAVTVSGRGSGRVNLAGLKPGQRTRLIYRMMIYRRRKNERKGFNETDYARLLDAAHQQLGGPIVLIWDNVNTHIDTLMRSLIDTRPWLTVFYLPTYAPELNPVETCGRTSNAAWAIWPPARSTTSPRSSAAGSSRCNTAPTSWTPSLHTPA